MRLHSLLLLACGLALVLLGIWVLVDARDGGILARASVHAQNQAGGTDSDPGEDATDAQGANAADPAGRVALGGLLATDEPAAPEEKLPPSVVGRVLSPDGAPLPGVLVLGSSGEHWAQVPLDVEPEAMPKGWPAIKRTETDAEGRFRFESLKSGTLRLVLRAPGCAPRIEDRLTLAPGYQTKDLGDLALERGATLSGRVVDRAGKGIAGARLFQVLDGRGAHQGVVVPGRGIELAQSGAEGAFTVDQLAVGPWHLFIDAEGYQVGEEEGLTERPGEVRAGLFFRLEKGSEVCGRVLPDEHSPRPEGLRVVARLSEERDNQAQAPPGADASPTPPRLLRSRSVGVDAEGQFCVGGLQPGKRYRLALWQTTPEIPFKRVGGVDTLSAWSGEHGLTFMLKPEAALTFRVVDAKSGEPLREFFVWYGIGRERSLRDDKGEVQRKFEDGRVRCSDLRPMVPPKPAVVRVRATGYKEYENKNVALQQGAPTDLGEIKLERAALVRVKVLDDRDGKPVQGARVLCGLQDKGNPQDYLSGPDDQEFWGDPNWQFARTAADGSASFTSAPGKTVAVRADAKGFLDSTTEKLLLPAEGDGSLVLRLKRGGSVLVRVDDGFGHAVVGVGIAHKPPADQPDQDEGWTVDSAEQKSDTKGEARFDALVPGVHAFRLHDQVGQVWHRSGEAGTSEGWIQTTVAEGSEATLALNAPPRGVLFGVVREGGRPLEGAHLKLTELREGEQPVDAGWNGPTDPLAGVTDHEGRYRLEGLRCGNYMVAIHHPGRRMPGRFPVEVRAVERAYDFNLDVTAIEGRVTDVTGKPLGGLEVYAYVANQEGWDEEPYQIVLREDERGSTRINYEQQSRRSEHTDEQGRFLLRGLAPNQPLIVHIEGDTVETVDSAPITLAPDELRRGVDFALRMAGLIRLELEGGEPNQGSWYEVRALLVHDGKEDLRSSAWIGPWNRREELRSLSPGHYKLVCTAQGGASAGQPQVVELDLHEGESARAAFQAR